MALILEAVVIVALVPLMTEAAGFVRAVLRRRATMYGVVAPVFVAAAGVNLLLLAGLAGPLSRALTEERYVAAIREAEATGDSHTAAAVATIAVQQHPESIELARLLPEVLLRAGRSDELQRYFQVRLTNGPRPDSRAELLTLARVIRLNGWPETEAIRSLSQAAATRSDLVEIGGLLEMQLHEELRRDPAAASELLRRAGATMVGSSASGQAIVEGFTVQRTHDSRREIVIYFRPLVSWTGRAIWLHAYPNGAPAYIDVGPSLPAFDGWGQGELAWEVFRTQDAGCFNLYTGVTVGSDLGPAVPLGWIGECANAR